MKPIRVMIIDDHPIVRFGLEALLSEYPDMRVVGQAADGATALNLVPQLEPDVILLDIRLAAAPHHGSPQAETAAHVQEMDGLELARQLKRQQAPGRIIILTSYTDGSYLLEATQIGVHGYILKNASAEILADAIRRVFAGERWLSPELAPQALIQLETLSQGETDGANGFTMQELQILKLIAQGATTQDLATHLFLSERTAKRRLKRIFGKLGVTSRVQAVSEAYKRGLL